MGKHFKYISYIIRHKWFVLYAGILTGASLWRLAKHDWTKFLPSEWTPYTRKFYGQPTLGHVVEVKLDDGSIGPGRIVNTRDCETSRYAVKMLSDWPPEWFWANDSQLPILERIETGYEQAHLKHVNRNDHHWNYWTILNGQGGVIALDIPDPVLRELVADWMGANRAATGQWKLSKWYSDNCEGILMHRRSRAFVESLIKRMAQIGMA